MYNIFYGKFNFQMIHNNIFSKTFNKYNLKMNYNIQYLNIDTTIILNKLCEDKYHLIHNNMYL